MGIGARNFEQHGRGRFVEPSVGKHDMGQQHPVEFLTVLQIGELLAEQFDFLAHALKHGQPRLYFGARPTRWPGFNSITSVSVRVRSRPSESSTTMFWSAGMPPSWRISGTVMVDLSHSYSFPSM